MSDQGTVAGRNTDTTGDNPKRDDNVMHWVNEIASAKKREKNYRKEGQRIIDIYTGKETEKQQFAILFSNTETLLPAVYSQVPRPVVNRRFKDEDPMGKLSADASRRALEFLLDSNIEGYETFDQAMKASVIDALLPGRGVTAVVYEAEVEDVVPDGAADGTEPIPVTNFEYVCTDSIAWDRVFFGYAKKWSRVPWIAYEKHLDRAEAEKLFPSEIVAKITFTEGEDADTEDGERSGDDERNLGERKTAVFYQIWDKTGGRKIRYVCPQYADAFCKVEDDPLELTGFFNCPKPLMFVEKSNDLLPTPLYALYESQASELNRITRRINNVVEAVKARAIYDGELGDDIKSLLSQDDNALVPADKTSSLAAEKGLQNAIWFWPIEQLVNVLRELYVAREQCKQVIYEISGIADIMRGQSDASETLGAQEIKQSWGTLRLKRLQKEIQRYARDLLRMMLEVAATKFSERTWAQMTGLPFLTTEQRQQLEPVAQAAMAQAQQMQAMQQAPTQQQIQQAQQLQAEMAKPVWGAILDILRNDTLRAYRIDIETNSTIEAEATEDQKNIADVMNALAQYLNGVAPLVVSGAMPFEAAQAMMLAIVRRFRFGPEIEDYVKAMKQPTPPDEAKQKAEMQAKQEEAKFDREAKQADFQLKQAEAKIKGEVDQAKAAAEMEKIRMETEASREEHALKMEELQAKAAYNRLMADLKTRQMEEKIAAAKAMPKKQAEPAGANA